MTLALSIQLTSLSGNGKSESFTVDAERVRIGSAAYCEVRLPHGEAAPVQLVLEDGGPLGLRAELVADLPLTTVDGKPLSSGVLAPSSVIEIGSTRLAISTLGGAVVGAGPVAKQKTSPVTLVAGAIAIPLALAQFSLPEEDDELGSQHQPPALFASAAPACPQTEPTAALSLAAEQRALGDAKRERRPFRASQGVRAVELYGTAAACFRAGGHVAPAAAAERDAVALKRDLDESYRTHRVRLEHALSTKNYKVAEVEVQALRDLLSGQQGEYTGWLQSLSRRLSLRLGKKQ
jgi:hypothetical protein